MDEPFKSLDYSLRQEMLTYLKSTLGAGTEFGAVRHPRYG